MGRAVHRSGSRGFANIEGLMVCVTVSVAAITSVALLRNAAANAVVGGYDDAIRSGAASRTMAGSTDVMQASAGGDADLPQVPKRAAEAVQQQIQGGSGFLDFLYGTGSGFIAQVVDNIDFFGQVLLAAALVERVVDDVSTVVEGVMRGEGSVTAVNVLGKEGRDFGGLLHAMGVGVYTTASNGVAKFSNDAARGDWRAAGDTFGRSLVNVGGVLVGGGGATIAGRRVANGVAHRIEGNRLARKYMVPREYPAGLHTLSERAHGRWPELVDERLGLTHFATNWTRYPDSLRYLIQNSVREDLVDRFAGALKMLNFPAHVRQADYDLQRAHGIELRQYGHIFSGQPPHAKMLRPDYDTPAMRADDLALMRESSAYQRYERAVATLYTQNDRRAIAYADALDRPNDVSLQRAYHRAIAQRDAARAEVLLTGAELSRGAQTIAVARMAAEKIAMGDAPPNLSFVRQHVSYDEYANGAWTVRAQATEQVDRATRNIAWLFEAEQWESFEHALRKHFDSGAEVWLHLPDRGRPDTTYGMWSTARGNRAQVHIIDMDQNVPYPASFDGPRRPLVHLPDLLRTEESLRAFRTELFESLKRTGNLVR